MSPIGSHWFNEVSQFALTCAEPAIGFHVSQEAAPAVLVHHLATYIVIVRTLRHSDAGAMRLLVAALVVLNFLVAANHFATIVASGGAPLNVVAGAINASSGILGLIALWQARDAGATHGCEVAED